MNYYRQVTRFTEIKTEKWILENLIWDIDFLFDCVKSILIHPVDTKLARVKYDRSKSGVFHALNTTVEQMLKYDKLAPFLKQRKLPLNTTPQDKAVLSCDHHAVLFTSFVRNLNIPIRTRTGFARYLVKGALIPHWITEIYNEEANCWEFVDPERRITAVEKESFLLAGQAWQYFEKNPNAYIPSYSGLKGKQGLKYAVICDLNCIFKNELLGYEWRLKSFNKKKPDIVRASYEKLECHQQHAVSRIAELLSNPDLHTSELWDLYERYIIEPGTARPDF